MLADPEPAAEELRPDALVDAILAKRNLGTCITDAPVVVGGGAGHPQGRTAMQWWRLRGHTLGRVIYPGSAPPNTSRGASAAFAGERVPRPADGILHQLADIGVTVLEGDVVATVEGRRRIISGVPGRPAEGTPVSGG